MNWCPGLGTVVANEEVTADGRSDRGNFPVFKRNMRQWMMRITAYADRLIDDLDLLDWTDAIKAMQRNWIGRSEGATVHFDVAGSGPAAGERITVFTTRPDTLFGATFMVLAPEHPLVDTLTTAEHADAVAVYRRAAEAKKDIDRQDEGREKTGVFTGAYAVNPLNGEQIPVWIADYVLMGYGTGAIMAVPCGDQRDFEFARKFGLDIVAIQEPTDGRGTDCSAVGRRVRRRRPVRQQQQRVAQPERPGHQGRGCQHHQRLAGGPRPRPRHHHLQAARLAVQPPALLGRAVPDRLRRRRQPARPAGRPALPVLLPETDQFSPRTFDPDDAMSNPESPLDRLGDWVEVTLDLGDGPQQYRRDTNVMPQWAGSCWYELRYLDPTNENAFVAPENEAYWMGPQGTKADGTAHPGGADLYVGGVEHAVLHLLYARFWHKVLFDLGHVSSVEPFHKLFNQGYILAAAFTDERGMYVEASQVEATARRRLRLRGPAGQPRVRQDGQEPEERARPDGAVRGVRRRHPAPVPDGHGPARCLTPVGEQGRHRRAPLPAAGVAQHRRRGHRRRAPAARRPVRRHPARAARTIAAVREELDNLRFNTAIAKLIELNNHLTKLGGCPATMADAFVTMVAPFAPHIAEELWSRLGHTESVTYAPFPVADPALLVADTVEYPVQINGKVRGRMVVASDASNDEVQAAAMADDKVQAALAGATPKKVIVVPGRMVNIVAPPSPPPPGGPPPPLPPPFAPACLVPPVQEAVALWLASGRRTGRR